MIDKKLGIIVPYRNRDEQLKKFKRLITRYLERTGIPFEIIIVHQDDAKQFNRGMLLNIGFKCAKNLNCDYVVFHDVDMIPIHVDYSYSEHPVHLATGFKTTPNEETREIFDEYFGGVTLFPVDVFEKINGYSNKYWGWGYEDTDLLYRCFKKDVNLNTLKLKNMGRFGTSLKFNGENAYIKGNNTFNLNNNITFFISFYSESPTFDFLKETDDFNVFTIPGYDFAISYNSFLRYNFCAFNEFKKVLYVNSKIKKNYKTNITVSVDCFERLIKVYQDGVLIGETKYNVKLHNYNKEPFFYLGVGHPGRENNEKYFKGCIDSFAVFNGVLTDDEILEVSNNKYKGLTQNFGNYFSSHLLELYYDAKFIKDYKLIDLSGNNNHGEIKNCEIVENELDEYVTVKIPHRRESVFSSLPHEENGFFENKWKYQATRWNQLRFHNEVNKNDELLENDGLSTLEFIEHGLTTEKNITHINVGI
jgi:hypothetical protein